MEESKLGEWREALREAASSPFGWDMHNVVSWHQLKFIEEIVKHIMGRRQDTHMSATIFPPRIEAAKEYLNLLLSVVSDDILVIGHGELILPPFFDQNFSRFKEGRVFLSDVSETAEQPNGLISLLKRLLCDILEEEDIKIENVEEGTLKIKSALCGKRVLVVLDNVKKLEQLNALARKRDWFGLGSRVIVTAKDPYFAKCLGS